MADGMEELGGESLNIVERNIEQLKDLFPEIVTEDKVDFEKLRLVLGDEIEDSAERYEFTWPGKRKAIQIAQTPSTGTLRPCPDESKDWDTTKNLYIEGDNLEVLKLLQKSYHGKVKMIYIDPPYNTGKDFVYKDNFKDSIKNYKEITNQGLKTNAETSGRYHSDWLNMMYPRLRLARNLLTDDGVIFISIDDNEVSNLTKLADEVFGEDNRLAIISVINNLKGRSDSDNFATCGEYLVVYAKSASNVLICGFDLSEDEIESDYVFQDEVSAFKPIGFRKTGANWEREKRPKMFYPILFKEGKFSTVTDQELAKIYDGINFDDSYVSSLSTKYQAEGYKFILPTDGEGRFGRWRWGVSTFRENRHTELILNNRGSVQTKMRATFEDGIVRTKAAKTVWYKASFDSGSAAKALFNLMELDVKVFDYPKSLDLLTDIINISTGGNDIVLDFFSGSATLAHAVMRKNLSDRETRRFIMVQLPEQCDPSGNAWKMKFKNICEIAKYRLKKSAEDILLQAGLEGISLDTGFKVFKLDSSNIAEWDGMADLAEQTLLDAVDGIKVDRSDEDVLYESMLKWGIDLTLPVEEIKLENSSLWSIGAGYLVTCLSDEITLATVQAIADLRKSSELPVERVLLRDSALENDNVKINATQILKAAGVQDIRTI